MAKKETTVIEFEGQLKLDAKDAENKLSAVSKQEITVPVKLNTNGARLSIDNLRTRLLQKIGSKDDAVNVDAKVRDGNRNSNSRRNNKQKNHSDVDDKYKSLRARRKEALDNAEKVWVNSNGNSKAPAYLKARKQFIEANKEYVEFAQKTGKTGLSSLIKEYENMMGSYVGKTNPLRREIERMWKEAIKRQDELVKELASKNPVKQQAKVIADNVKNKFTLEKESSQGAAVSDAIANLKQGINAGLPTNEVQRLRDELKKATEQYLEFRKQALNFDKNAEAKLLGNIAGKVSFDSSALDDLIKKAQVAKQEYKSLQDQIKGTIPSSPKNNNGRGAGGNANTAQTFAAEAKRYAAEAEKAWRDAGNKSTPEFERLRKQFMDTMNQMVRFRREIGDLSAGQAAGVYSKMASSLGKLSPLYDGLIKKARELNKEQTRVNQDAKESGSGGRWFSSSLPIQFVHFVGRSSKGFGSFGEATADVLSKMQAAGGAMGRLGALGGIVAGVFAGIAAGSTLLINSMHALGGAITSVVTTIYNVLKPGIELYKQQTSAIFSFTAALQSNAKDFTPTTGNGKDVTREQAFGVSRELIQRATLDAEMSAFSLEELLRSLQGTLPILLSKGFSLDQAYEINRGVAGVAKMTQLTPSQILQETRDLAQGSITSRGSQVANALGITNQDIAKYKGDVEGLYDFLMKKFANYNELLSQYEDTALGRYQQLEERWQNVTKTIVDGISAPFKGVFEYLINATGQWVDDMGNKLNALTGKWQDKDGNSFDPIKKQWENPLGEVIQKAEEDIENVGKGAEFNLSKQLKELIPIFQEIIVYTAQLTDDFLEFVGIEAEGEDPLQKIKVLIKACIKAFFSLLKTAVLFIEALEEVLDWLDPIVVGFYNLGVIGVRGFKEMSLAAADLIANLLKVANVLGPIVTAFGIVTANPAAIAGGAAVTALTNLYSDDINSFIDETHKLQDELHKEGPKFISSMGDLLSVNGKDGAITQKIKQSMAEYADEQAKVGASKTGLSAKNLKGIPSNALSDKERKKAIQEAQKAMKANIQELKDGLKDFITDLKDTLEKNKIAYDEGFMSMREYFEQKAEIERQEAEAKLKEAEAEKAEILKTPFNNPDEQRKELSKLNREIKQYTRELNKATRAQQEVARNMERFTASQKASYAFMTNNLGKGQNGNMVGQKVDPASFDALMSFNPESLEDKIAWAMQMAMLQGFDKDAAAGIVGNWIYESGGNLNPKAVGDSGSSYGIAQWHNDDWVAGDAGHGRWKELIDWANANNSDWTDFRTQVLFGLYELTKGREKGNYYANNGNWKQQARNYTSNVERPSASAKESSMSSRISYAGKAYELGGKQLVYASNSLNSAANNLNNSSNNLVDSSGKLLGYVPEDQYSRGGIDTRYSDFQDMSSGVDAQIAGLDKKVAQVFNLFAKKYYEKTNEKVLWTSFTGDMRPGYHNPHASGESGHRGGKKGDFWVNNQSVAAQIAKEIGLALSFEIDHYDMSAHGGVYSPGLLTPNQRADELWSKLQQSTQQANSAVKALADTDLPDLSVSMNDFSEAIKIIEKKAPELGALMPKIPDTTKLGHESFKVSQEYLTTYFEKLFGNGSRVTGNLKAQLAQEYTKLILNVVKYRSDPMMLEQILIEFKDKVNDKMVSFAKEMADYNLKVIEENAVYRGTDMMAGKFSFEELTKLYNSYFSDPNNNLGVAKFIDMLEKLYAEFEARGFTKEAFEIRNYLNGLKQRLVNLQKSWIDKISDFYDRQQSLFDATEGFTNLQREFGTRELKAYKAQANYEAYSIQLEKVNKDIAENNKKLEEARELLTKCAEGTKEWAKQSSKVNYYSGEASRLEALRQEYEYQKKLNDLQRKQPEYLRDLKNTAKQALEDGLVTFLTDGVNEAKSLGEALRNLAVSFLKEIQKVSAKWMVKSLMTKLFGHYYMDGAPNVSNTSNLLLNQAEQQTILQTRMVELLSGRSFTDGEGTFSIGGNTVSESQVQPWTNHFNSQPNNVISLKPMEQLTSPFTGVPTQTWSPQPMYQQSVSFNGYTVGSDMLQQFNQKLQESSTITLPNFANNLGQATQDVTQWSQGFSNLDTTTYTANAQQLGQAMEQASISVSTASTEMQTSASTITSGLQTAFMELEVQARSAAGALQKIAFGGVGAFAEGGYISGPGTSTSDSIPAMLSSGEYVIKASSVRKYGTNFLNSVNNGNFTKIKSGVHHYAEGGLVSELAQEQTARGMGNFGRDISNNISNTANINVALVRDRLNMLRKPLDSATGIGA